MTDLPFLLLLSGNGTIAGPEKELRYVSTVAFSRSLLKSACSIDNKHAAENASNS